VVTWFAASTNQRRSAFSIPHFTFRVPHFRISPTAGQTDDSDDMRSDAILR